MSFGFFGKIITGAVFNVLSLLTFGAKSLFVIGEHPFGLRIVGCLAVSLASPAGSQEPPPSPRYGNQNCLWHWQMSLGWGDGAMIVWHA